MPITAAAISAGGSLLGGLMSGGSGQGAANTSAQAQLEAARIAADAAKFRPVGVTNTFGTSNFQFDPSGYLTSAGYNLSTPLQNVQDTLMGGLGQTQKDVANIQAMGRQYMAQSPQEAAQQWMQSQQALLAPSREQQSANLLNQLSNTGRTGLSVAQGGDLGMSNPEFQALANARALQDLQLAANAQQAGQQQYTFGQGLLTSAYSPLQTQLGTAQSVEGLGQTPFDLGSQLGGRAAQAGANVGQSLLQGGLSAAKTAQAGNAYNPYGTAISGLASNQAFNTGLANWLGGANGSNEWGNPIYNPQTQTGGWTGTSLANTFYGTGGIDG